MVLLSGMEYRHDPEQLRSSKMTLNERRKWLIRSLRKLKWTNEQMAKRLQVTTSEFQSFLDGRTENCGEYTFADVYYYITKHLEAFEADGGDFIRIDQFERKSMGGR